LIRVRRSLEVLTIFQPELDVNEKDGSEREREGGERREKIEEKKEG